MNTTCRMLLLVVAILAWFTPTAHARWYDPTTGRWSQRDPAGYVDGGNLYQYVASNPLKYVDPWGLDKLVFDGKKLCRVSDDLQKCIKCWKGRSGRPIRDKDGNIERDDDGMPKFPEPTVDEQKKKGEGPIPAGNWRVPCKREKSSPGTPGFWKRTDWNDYEKNRRWYQRPRVDAPRGIGPWGEWFVRCEPGKGCVIHGRSNFNIHGGRYVDGGEWGSAGCIDLMCQDDDFFQDLPGMCGSGTHVDLIVDYSGNSMPADCNEPADPCKRTNGKVPGDPP